MAKTIGVVLPSAVYAGLVVDHASQGRCTLPRSDRRCRSTHSSSSTPTRSSRPSASRSSKPSPATRTSPRVGVAIPGLIRNGVVEEAPNLPQLKGARIARARSPPSSRSHGIDAPVTVLNDADGVAAGLAAVHGKLDSFIRVWTLGIGIGYGRYPFAEGVWEGGHTVVSLDDKENYCGCGGTRPPRRHHGPPRHAPALPRHGAGRSLRTPPTRDKPDAALPRLQAPLAQGPRRRHRHLHPHAPAPASSSSPASTSASSTSPCSRTTCTRWSR